MHVNTIPTRFFGLVGQGSSTSATTPADDRAEPRLDPTAGSTLPGVDFREILGQYDVRSISPREFSELAQRLFDSGAISESDLRDLSQIRLDLDAARVDADQPVDLVGFVTKKLDDQEQRVRDLTEKNPGAAATIDRDAYLSPAKRQLDWLNKFALVQSGAAGEAGLNELT